MSTSEFVYDLKTPETTWKGCALHNYPTGDLSTEAGRITQAVGPHGLYWFMDSIMHKVPEAIKDTWEQAHYHVHGYETFFLDSGRLMLFINGQRVICEPGDIVHLQAGQAHGFRFLEDTRWRGTYSDLHLNPEAADVARVRQYMPELADDPELAALMPRGPMDSVLRENFVYVDAPKEQCTAVRHVDRPLAAYEFPGVSMRVIVERWENGGVKEMVCAVCEPGFTAEWVKYPPLRELLYLRKGRIKFTVLGREFVADDECVIDIPRFAPHSMEVLEHAELYDLGGQSWWSMFFQSLQYIRTKAPERDTPETLEALKKRYDIPIKSIGMK